LLSAFPSFLFQRSGAHRDLPSFPTRRSSDLSRFGGESGERGPQLLLAVIGWVLGHGAVTCLEKTSGSIPAVRLPPRSWQRGRIRNGYDDDARGGGADCSEEP